MEDHIFHADRLQRERLIEAHCVRIQLRRGTGVHDLILPAGRVDDRIASQLPRNQGHHGPVFF